MHDQVPHLDFRRQRELLAQSRIYYGLIGTDQQAFESQLILTPTDVGEPVIIFEGDQLRRGLSQDYFGQIAINLVEEGVK